MRFLLGGMERMSPVRLGPSWALAAWLCCCERCQLDTAAPPEASLLASPPASRNLLLALSAQRHGDFPRSKCGSHLPVCALRSRASPASQKAAAPETGFENCTTSRICKIE